jgi:hypothetical protein
VSNEAADELWRAINKFGPMASPHEGWAVIHEEMDELWTHVKENTGRSDAARTEAIQIAAMALRYVADLCDGQFADTDTSESRAGSQNG